MLDATLPSASYRYYLVKFISIICTCYSNVLVPKVKYILVCDSQIKTYNWVFLKSKLKNAMHYRYLHNYNSIQKYANNQNRNLELAHSLKCHPETTSLRSDGYL